MFEDQSNPETMKEVAAYMIQSNTTMLGHMISIHSTEELTKKYSNLSEDKYALLRYNYLLSKVNPEYKEILKICLEELQ